MMHKEDLIGQIFDDLTVIKFAYKKSLNYWECKCSCGNTKIISVTKLHKHIGTKCRCNAPSKKDLTGQKFGKLTAIKPVRQNKIPCWECQCDCGNTKVINAYYLQKGIAKNCGDYHKHPKIDLTGQKFNMLTVLHVDEENHGRDLKWICQCDCGNLTTATTYHLMNNMTCSCGCAYKEAGRNNKKKSHLNKYDLSGEYGIGWTSNRNTKFYFDLEDYEKIKLYTWRENRRGYIETSIYNKDEQKTHAILMHRFILGLTDPNMIVDHIHHNTTDNRKSEIRATTQANNVKNHPLQKNNTSGVTGVRFDQARQKYTAYIRNNKKNIMLGLFDQFEDAVKARKKAEQEYYGEYAYAEE